MHISIFAVPPICAGLGCPGGAAPRAAAHHHSRHRGGHPRRPHPRGQLCGWQHRDGGPAGSLAGPTGQQVGRLRPCSALPGLASLWPGMQALHRVRLPHSPPLLPTLCHLGCNWLSFCHSPSSGEELKSSNTRAARAPPSPRPLRVLISDCRVMVDGTARDAVWAAGGWPLVPFDLGQEDSCGIQAALFHATALHLLYASQHEHWPPAWRFARQLPALPAAVEHLISAFTSSGEKQRRNLSDAVTNQARAHASPLDLPRTPCNFSSACLRALSQVPPCSAHRAASEVDWGTLTSLLLTPCYRWYISPPPAAAGVRHVCVALTHAAPVQPEHALEQPQPRSEGEWPRLVVSHWGRAAAFCGGTRSCGSMHASCLTPISVLCPTAPCHLYKAAMVSVPACLRSFLQCSFSAR